MPGLMPRASDLEIATRERRFAVAIPALLVLGVFVTACAPVLSEGPARPDQPRIIEFDLDVASVPSGCPVRAIIPSRIPTPTRRRQ